MTNFGKKSLSEFVESMRGNIVDFTIESDPERNSDSEVFSTIYSNKWIDVGKNQEIIKTKIGEIYEYITAGGNVDKLKVKFHSHTFEWKRKH